MVQANFERFSYLWEETKVPVEGKADTLAGELVRAVNRMVYRWYNDGDQYDLADGNPANAAYNFLHEKIAFSDFAIAAETIEQELFNMFLMVEDYVKSGVANIPNNESFLDYAEVLDCGVENVEW